MKREVTKAPEQASDTATADRRERENNREKVDVQFLLLCLGCGFSFLLLHALLLGDVPASLIVVKLLLLVELSRHCFQPATLVSDLCPHTDNVYGAVIATMVTARVHPVHLMNAD